MPIITEARAVIAAPAAVAWRLLADYANDPLWRARVRRMEQSPPGQVFPGATAVEEIRVLGTLSRAVVEVVTVTPGTSFTWRAIDGADAEGHRTITALGDDRCELHTWRVIRLSGAQAWGEPLARWALTRGERADVQRAAALVEAITR